MVRRGIGMNLCDTYVVGLGSMAPSHVRVRRKRGLVYVKSYIDNSYSDFERKNPLKLEGSNYKQNDQSKLVS